MTKDPEVVRTLFEYRDELGRRENALLKRMAKYWLGVERDIRGKILDLAQAVITELENGRPVTPQYIYSLQRYKEFAKQAKDEFDYYDKNIITLITDQQKENFNLGLDAANEAILKSYPINSPSWTQLHISAFETMAGMLSDGTPLNRLISRDYPLAIEGINQALINGVTLGKGYKQVADDMVMASRMAFERSVLIARTEVNRAYRFANTEQYRQSGVVTGFKRLVYKPTACFACLMMDGEVIPVGQELYDHPRGKCILPGQYVSGPVPEAFISRHYNGNIVIIRTASGKLLSVTPNHPILTDHGWISANLIKEGMNVICDSRDNWASGGVRPDEYQVPTLVENIPRSLDMFRLVSVPGSAEDFHGDGVNGEISVIWANRFLYDRIKSDFLKKSVQIPFSFGFRFHKILSLEEIRDALVRNMSPGSDSLYAIASNVVFDRVVKVDLGSFCGQVYNLQTKEQWYFSNGIMTHNCSAVPITIGGNTADWQRGPEWFFEQSKEDQRRIMGPGRFDIWDQEKSIHDLRFFTKMNPNEVWGPAPYIIPLKNLPKFPIVQPIDFYSDFPQRVGIMSDLQKFYDVSDPGYKYVIPKPVIYNNYARDHLLDNKDHEKRIAWILQNEEDFIRAVEKPEIVEKVLRSRNDGHYSATHFVRVSNPWGKDGEYLGVAISLSLKEDNSGYHSITTIYSRPTRNIINKDGSLKKQYRKIE